MFTYDQISASLWFDVRVFLATLKPSIWEKWDIGKLYYFFLLKIHSQTNKSMDVIPSGTNGKITVSTKKTSNDASLMVMIDMPMHAPFWVRIAACLVCAFVILLSEQFPFVIFCYSVLPYIAGLFLLGWTLGLTSPTVGKCLFWIPNSPSTVNIFYFADTAAVDFITPSRGELSPTWGISTYSDYGRLFFAHGGGMA